MSIDGLVFVVRSRLLARNHCLSLSMNDREVMEWKSVWENRLSDQTESGIFFCWWFELRFCALFCFGLHDTIFLSFLSFFPSLSPSPSVTQTFLLPSELVLYNFLLYKCLWLVYISFFVSIHIRWASPTMQRFKNQSSVVLPIQLNNLTLKIDSKMERDFFSEGVTHIDTHQTSRTIMHSYFSLMFLVSQFKWFLDMVRRIVRRKKSWMQFESTFMWNDVFSWTKTSSRDATLQKVIAWEDNGKLAVAMFLPVNPRKKSLFGKSTVHRGRPVSI